MRPSFLLTLERVCCILVASLLSTHAIAQQYGWTVAARPDSVYGLNAVCFVDSVHGWCAGSLKIHRTTDAGATWKTGVQPYNPNSFFGLSFSDPLRGWAAGSLDNASGFVWRTTNGGLSWIDQTGYRDKRRYVGTTALSTEKNITVGVTLNSFPDTGKVIQTTDGGAIWIERTLADSIGGIEGLFFLDPLHGWASSGIINGGPVILRTRDGGTSWEVLPSQGQHQLFFLDTLRGWGAIGSVYRTTDGGSSWQYLSSVQDTLWGELSIRVLSFLDSLNGRAFGGIFYQGIITEGIYRTTDGGNTWFRESIGLTGDFGYIVDAQMFNDHLGWAVCHDGSVLRYQGATDTAGKPPGIPQAFSLAQNYPNPFNPATTIEYAIPHRTRVELAVYDILGRMVKELLNGEQDAGTHLVRFDGRAFPSGVYYYRLTTEEFTETKAMVLVR